MTKSGVFMKFFVTFILVMGLYGCVHKQKQNPMLGVWENTTNGDIVGIKLYGEDQCDIYIERAFQPRTVKACKFEPFEQQYVVFLVKEDGSCDANPDFEFAYEPSAPLIHLFVQGSPIGLSKIE